MKIGIITVYDSANYGAFLQAYASKRFLESYGHEVVFIKVRTSLDRFKEFWKIPKGIRGKVRFFLNIPFYVNKYTKYRKDLNYFKQCDIDKVSNENIDLIFIGSDELWNVKSDTFQKGIFYGENVDVSKKVAYAVSAGQADYSDYTRFPQYLELMKQVNILGVRDENTRRLVKNFVEEDVPIVCDPTCLVDSHIFFEHKYHYYKRFLLIYSYSVPNEHVELIKRFAQEKRLLIVSLCMPHKWCDVNMNCSALEFSSLIKQAEFVYTTTFHGSIFTFLNEKQCVIYAKSKKLIDFVQRYSMDKVCIDLNVSYSKFCGILNQDTDYHLFNKKMKTIVDESREILNEYINCS